MQIKTITEVGSRGILFTYEFGDSVYLINSFNKLFLCDTNEGYESMEYVKNYIREHKLTDKTLFIFNSHSDWDHIWGNDAFKDPYIIGHLTCKDRMMERAEFDLIKQLHSEDIKIKFPNITFKEKLVFVDEDIDFIYAPGHTVCSSICFDRIDKVLYVGDLLEIPIPVLNDIDLIRYIETLQKIKDIDATTIITTHSNIVNQDLIDRHIEYLQDVIKGKFLIFNNEYTPIRHAYNLKNLLLLNFDEKMKTKLKSKFNFLDYKLDLWKFIVTKHNNKDKGMWNLIEMSYQDLKEDLEEYYGKTNNY